jgi:hypothetical protein
MLSLGEREIPSAASASCYARVGRRMDKVAYIRSRRQRWNQDAEDFRDALKAARRARRACRDKRKPAENRE